jgi:hypothetical protein
MPIPASYGINRNTHWVDRFPAHSLITRSQQNLLQGSDFFSRGLGL